MSMEVANSSTFLNGTPKGSKKTSLVKKLLGGVLIVIFLSVVLVVVLLLVTKLDTPGDTTTCDDKDCRTAAEYFSQRMNTSADPCDDFHEYVCGNWSRHHPIPEDKGRYGVFEDLRDDLADTCIRALEQKVDKPKGILDNTKIFYQSCTENVNVSKGVDQLRSLLISVGISPDMKADNSLQIDILLSLSSIVRNFGLNFILSFGVDADDKNTIDNVIVLDQPSSFGLGRSFLVNAKSAGKRITAYKEYIRSGLCLLNQDLCKDEIPKVVEQVFDLEVQIAEMTRDPVERRDANSWYYPMTIAELNRSVPKINFTTFIQKILEGHKINIKDDERVIVKEETYFKKVSELIMDPKKTSAVSHYLGWRLVQSFGPVLFEEMRTIKFQFDKVNAGIQKDMPEDRRCFELTNGYLGHAVGRLYVDQKFDQSSKSDVHNMVANLANAFRDLVKNNQWMDEETKSASLDKLDKMVEFIGYPDWIKDDAQLEDYYQITFINVSDFKQNLIDVMTFSNWKSFGKLKIKNNRTTDWVSQASIVNAFYSPSANSITFPAGILQIPFYGKSLKVLNYGAIGYVIGHEITHGYDDQGAQFDGEGNLRNWWSNDTAIKFNLGKKCFIEQYSNITDRLTGLQLNGAQTIGENIADNGGIREAFKAYTLSGRDRRRLVGLEDFNDHKLFYISAANVWCTKFRPEEMINQINQGVHSPGMYRAYLPLANTEDFAKAFNCPVGSKMNPEHRCTIW